MYKEYTSQKETLKSHIRCLQDLKKNIQVKK